MNGFHDAGAFSDFLASILSWKYESIIYNKKLLENYLVEDADCYAALYTR